MLLPNNVNPDDSIYYNGALVLSVLQNNNSVEIIELYQHVKKIRKISFQLYILCLDWLFLIDVAIIEHNGRIKYVPKTT